MKVKSIDFSDTTEHLYMSQNKDGTTTVGACGGKNEITMLVVHAISVADPHTELLQILLAAVYGYCLREGIDFQERVAYVKQFIEI